MIELKPKFEEGYYSGLFSWEDLSSLINIRPLMTAERVYVYAPEDMKFTWTNDGWALDHNCYPPTLLRELMEKYVCYFCDMSRCTEKINAFAKEVEDTYQQHVDAHIYMCRNMDIEHPFGIHFDISDNIIIQCEGKTNFKVWNEIDNSLKLYESEKNVNMTMNNDPILDVEMKSGDAIWIPKYYPHLATSRTKRLSVSFPFSKTLQKKDRDRNWVTFDD